MGGAYPLYASLSQTVLSPRGTKRDPATMHGRGLMRPCETPEGNETATPLRLSIFFDFLGRTRF